MDLGLASWLGRRSRKIGSLGCWILGGVVLGGVR